MEYITYDRSEDDAYVTVTATMGAADVDEKAAVFAGVFGKHYGVEASTVAALKAALEGVRSGDDIDALFCEYLLNAALGDVLIRESIDALVAPGTHYEGAPREGEPFAFEFSILKPPKLALSSIDPVSITLPKRCVRDEDVEKKVRELAEDHAVFEEVEPAPLQEHDFAIVNLTMFINGAIENAFSGPGQRYAVEYGSMPDPFIDNLIGMNVGEKKNFSFELHHKDNLGRELPESDIFVCDAEVTMRLKKTVPQVTDEWVAELFPDIGNAERLRKAARMQIENEQILEESKLKAQLASEALMKRLDGSIPDELYTSAYQGMMNQIWNEVDRQGMTMEEYLERRGMGEDELSMQTLMRAGEMLRHNYALELLFDGRGMALTDEELDASIARVAESKGICADRGAVRKAGYERLATESAKRTKALRWLIESADITYED